MIITIHSYFSGEHLMLRIFTGIALGIILLGANINFAQADEKPVFNVIIKEHTFSPATIEVPANVKFKLVVDNQDATPEEFESNELHREKIISGNSKAIIFLGPLEAGEYGFFGEFNPETAQGTIVAK